MSDQQDYMRADYHVILRTILEPGSKQHTNSITLDAQKLNLRDWKFFDEDDARHYL